MSEPGEMSLAAFLEAHGLTFADFGRCVNRSRSTVRRWCLPPEHKDHLTPSRADLLHILRETRGAVTLATLMNVRELPRAAAAGTP